MELDIRNAAKLFRPNPSFEMIYFEAVRNSIDANATNFLYNTFSKYFIRGLKSLQIELYLKGKEVLRRTDVSVNSFRPTNSTCCLINYIMICPIDKINIDKNVEGLKLYLLKAVNGPTKSFAEISTIDKMGLYLIFDDEELLYIGMTLREGKKRLREMITSYKLHSFNRKLFAEHLRGENIFMNDKQDAVHVLNRKIAKELIDNNRLTIEQFKNYQKEVNNKIKRLKFKFLDCNLIDLPHIEHFAISVLKPLYND